MEADHISDRVADGKIVDHRMLLDSPALMPQLGVMARLHPERA